MIIVAEFLVLIDNLVAVLILFYNFLLSVLNVSRGSVPFARYFG